MKKRMAFSLIELIVVIAIIAILLGLLLPAVQKVREASNRTQCQNNLRQIGLGAHQYHNGMASFPVGVRFQGGKDPYPLMSWLTQLLPYVEQQGLWSATLAAYQQSPSPFNNPPHVGLATVISVFGCPSDGRTGQAQFAPRNKLNVAATSYLGVEGVDLEINDGVFFRDSHIRLADITDGTSQTTAVNMNSKSNSLRRIQLERSSIQLQGDHHEHAPHERDEWS